MVTKELGNVGEAYVLAKFVELNVPIYLQFGDNERADYIVLYNNIPIKIQVKTSSRYDGDKTEFDLCSSTTHRTKGKKHKYSFQEVNAFACYDIITKEIFLVENTENMTGITIRYTPPKNGQKKQIHFFEDYALSVETLQKVSKTVIDSYDKEKVQTTIGN